MVDNDRNLITGTQAITNLFKNYFEELLNNTQIVHWSDMYDQIIYDTM